MKHQNIGAKSAIANSCFSLIGPRQCSAVPGGPARRHKAPPMGLSKLGVKGEENTQLISSMCPFVVKCPWGRR